MLLTFNEMVELVGPYTAAGRLAEYWSTSVEDRRSFYLFYLFYLFLFVYLNSPADHLAIVADHRLGNAAIGLYNTHMKNEKWIMAMLL
jgi:hypothetical protein